MRVEIVSPVQPLLAWASTASKILSLRHSGSQIGERRRGELNRVRTCARSRKPLDRLLAETCAQNELFAAAGGRVDGLDGMVGERILARPDLQGFAAAASRDDQAGVVEDEFVCGRTEVQVIRSKVFVTGAEEQLVRCIGPALDVRICVFRRRAGRGLDLAVGQRRAIR